MKALDAITHRAALIREALDHEGAPDAHDFRVIEMIARAQAEMIERGLTDD